MIAATGSGPRGGGGDGGGDGNIQQPLTVRFIVTLRWHTGRRARRKLLLSRCVIFNQKHKALSSGYSETRLPMGDSMMSGMMERLMGRRVQLINAAEACQTRGKVTRCRLARWSKLLLEMFGEIPSLGVILLTIIWPLFASNIVWSPTCLRYHLSLTRWFM